MDTQINNAINAFLHAHNSVDREVARQSIICLMYNYPKNRPDYDYWRMRHLVGW